MPFQSLLRYQLFRQRGHPAPSMASSPAAPDQGNDHRQVVECLGKIIHQIVEPRVPVRLNHRNHPAGCAFARSGQDGANFHRMVA